MSAQTPSQTLQRGRGLIRDLAVRYHTANSYVFSSVLTGQDGESGELDVLVEPLPETTLFDVGGLQEALRVRVDVRTPMTFPRMSERTCCAGRSRCERTRN